MNSPAPAGIGRDLGHDLEDWFNVSLGRALAVSRPIVWDLLEWDVALSALTVGSARFAEQHQSVTYFL